MYTEDGDRRSSPDSFKTAAFYRISIRELLNLSKLALAMNLQGVRFYPMMKLALGFATECQRVNVRGRWINVKKAA